MAVARSSSVVVSALLVALLACTTTSRVAVAYSICDHANCGKGSCAEAPGLIPLTVGYECNCDPGWSRVLTAVPFSPCIIPNCSFDPACFNLTLKIPRGIPLTDPCVAVDCGSEGTCRKDEGMNFHCECNPGYVNLLNVTFLPCVKNCAFGPGCSTLGLSLRPRLPVAGAIGFRFTAKSTAAAVAGLARHGSDHVIAQRDSRPTGDYPSGMRDPHAPIRLQGRGDYHKKQGKVDTLYGGWDE